MAARIHRRSRIDHVIEFTWGADLVRIELETDGAGTLLTLTDTFV